MHRYTATAAVVVAVSFIVRKEVTMIEAYTKDTLEAYKESKESEGHYD
jgi:hypothetical protein